ncbi:hypothetical protein FH972_024436 [Carpinus fangiana]|uniref:non-specific serine/threonine protein kinase n=1 Tax=Carpinus fangiana TaxID=176857 RepID=A0A5N6KY08_9ROSI|nr:hypothetical protein FH972_024436 [Carpinus fangiana]
MPTPSPPPTPNPEMPRCDAEERFERITLPVEWVESYRPGGLHPVHLNDLFKDGQYRTIRKVGNGSFSTVWLAVDQPNAKFVVLKIIRASFNDVGKELDIYHQLKRLSRDEYMLHLVQLLDHFEHRGPNGKHCCLVFEVMGPSASYMVENLPPELKSPGAGNYGPFQVWMAKSIIKQVLLAVHELHERGVAHGDLHYGNILFTVKGLSTSHEKELAQNLEESLAYESGKLPPPKFSARATVVRRIDGKEDRWAPEYLIQDAPLLNYVDLSYSFVIKLSDVGAAFMIANPPTTCVTPISLRAPEIILDLPLDQRIDIWSFGCLIFEMITGQRLFAVSSFGDDEMIETNDDHLLQFCDTLGHLPLSLRSKWAGHSRYFGPDLEKIRTNVESDEVDVEDGDAGSGDGAEKEGELVSWDRFAAEKPVEIGDVEAAEILQLLRSILQYDPNARPTTGQLLEHPWIAAIK